MQKEWEVHFVTNPILFENLLSVTPVRIIYYKYSPLNSPSEIYFQNPGACLAAIHPKNLVVLLESGTSRFAQMVIDFLEKDEAEYQQPDSPYYAAEWFLFRHQSQPFTHYPEVPVLLWASRFALHALTVQDEPSSRDLHLKEVLVGHSNEILKKVDQLRASPSSSTAKFTLDSEVTKLENQIVSLWNQNFAHLLMVGTRHNGVAYEIALLMGRSQYPPRKDWPLLVRILCAVLHGKPERKEVDLLLETDFFTRLHERSRHDPDHTFELPSQPEFIAGLLSLQSGVLSLEWQVKLLTTEKVVIPDNFCNSRGLSNLEQGLLKLTSVSKIKIAPGKVRKRLEEHPHFATVVEQKQAVSYKQMESKRRHHFMRFLKVSIQLQLRNIACLTGFI